MLAGTDPRISQDGASGGFAIGLPSFSNTMYQQKKIKKRKISTIHIFSSLFF